MALFIHVDNQTKLWKAIQISPHFKTIEAPTDWFKYHIEKIYKTLPQNITPQQLIDINKNSLKIMVSQLTPKIQENRQIENSQMNTQPTNRIDTMNSLASTASRNTNVVSSSSDYPKYDALVHRSTPPDIKFTISTDTDGPINTDMNKIVEERNKDLALYSLPLLPSSSSSSSASSASSASSLPHSQMVTEFFPSISKNIPPMKLNITNETVDIDVDELILLPPFSKKTVQWSNSNNYNDNLLNDEKYEKIESMLMQIMKDLHILKNTRFSLDDDNDDDVNTKKNSTEINDIIE
jgi:hypothetical protein